MSHIAIVTHSDLRRLEAISVASLASASDADALDALHDELRRAQVVEPDEVPADVATLGSRVSLRSVDPTWSASITLVTPDQSNPVDGRVSVLAPLGAALLGRRAGTDVHWMSPSGRRRARIERILYQPESARQERAGPDVPDGRPS